MSTRSSIAIKNEDGSIDAIYCHNDGYLTNNDTQTRNRAKIN